jgi:hypothetical protein
MLIATKCQYFITSIFQGFILQRDIYTDTLYTRTPIHGFISALARGRGIHIKNQKLIFD